ncbi:hypothetical protein OQA88_6436 [Cercophora sp. LCS_1]
MSPIVLDVVSDFNPTKNDPSPASQQRTLLLAPPSLASHEERISVLFSTFDRAATDLHMLDRLAAGLVALPAATYDLVLILADPSGAVPIVGGRDVWARLVKSIKAGGKLRSEHGLVPDFREAVLAGLLQGTDGLFEKPDYAEEEVVPLRFGLKKKVNGATPAPAPAPVLAAPAGVGFVDFSDDLDLDADDDDGDLIDEDTLLTEEDLKRPVFQPPECQPQPGKKRRACKDCTCGLAERLEAEDKVRRDKADKDLNTLKFKADDLTELDFTVKGKTGSCNSCYLGDAFRCADCPYIGLPAFKPGEEVKIINNVAQL